MSFPARSSTPSGSRLSTVRQPSTRLTGETVTTTPGTPAEGQWFRFSPSVNCANYDTTMFENEVCIAGQHRGFVVVDHGGSDGIEADFATATWTDEGNPGPEASWQRNANGHCCIFAGGGGPLEQSFRTSSGSYEQAYQVIAGLPWSQLQVVVPPHA
jgi:hypothetical protein